MLVEIERTYFGCKVIVSRDDRSTSPYPWTIRIEEPSGVTHHYGGIRNKCETHTQAFKRGWWRAKWIRDDTHKERYVTVNFKDCGGSDGATEAV